LKKNLVLARGGQLRDVPFPGFSNALQNAGISNDRGIVSRGGRAGARELDPPKEKEGEGTGVIGAAGFHPGRFLARHIKHGWGRTALCRSTTRGSLEKLGACWILFFGRSVMFVIKLIRRPRWPGPPRTGKLGLDLGAFPGGEKHVDSTFKGVRGGAYVWLPEQTQDNLGAEPGGEGCLFQARDASARAPICPVYFGHTQRRGGGPGGLNDEPGGNFSAAVHWVGTNQAASQIGLGSTQTLLRGGDAPIPRKTNCIKFELCCSTFRWAHRGASFSSPRHGFHFRCVPEGGSTKTAENPCLRTEGIKKTGKKLISGEGGGGKRGAAKGGVWAGDKNHVWPLAKLGGQSFSGAGLNHRGPLLEMAIRFKKFEGTAS